MNSDLRDSDFLVPSAVDVIPINFAILDSDGVILWTNRAWKEFGEANDIAIRPDTIGVNYLEVTNAADDPTAREAYEGLVDVISGDRDGFELEYPCHSPDEKRWFLMRATRFSSAGTQYVAVAHIDISERVRKERDIERYQQIIETAGQLIYVTNPDGTITYVNPAFEKVTEYTAEEAIGKTPAILDAGKHEDSFFADLWETIREGNSWRGTIINRRKSGDLFVVQTTIEPIKNAEGELEGFLAVQTEVTDIEEMRRQLERQSEILRHDLRTELNLIMGHTEEIRQGFGNNRHANAIYEAAEALLSTVEKAAELRKFLERSSDPTPIDLVGIVANVVGPIQEQYTDVEFDVELPEEATILGLEELELALHEVITNSIVHNDHAEPRIAVSVREESEHWVLVVEDNGPGIPEMEFEWFDTDESTPIEHKQGIGLDLVYWITRRTGGHLQIEPSEPRGTSIEITLLRSDR